MAAPPDLGCGLVITIIGAINWGLIGILDFNLVAAIFGDGSLLSKIVYTLVGISGLVNIGILLVESAGMVPEPQ